MNQLDMVSICRVIDRLAKTKAISLDSRNEAFHLLGIEKGKEEYFRQMTVFSNARLELRQYQLQDNLEDITK